MNTAEITDELGLYSLRHHAWVSMFLHIHSTYNAADNPPSTSNPPAPHLETVFTKVSNGSATRCARPATPRGLFPFRQRPQCHYLHRTRKTRDLASLRHHHMNEQANAFITGRDGTNSLFGTVLYYIQESRFYTQSTTHNSLPKNCSLSSYVCFLRYVTLSLFW